MANNSAEFGAIGQVTVISKSGTNQLHGSLFDYYSTPWFRARNPFALQREHGIGTIPAAPSAARSFSPKSTTAGIKHFSSSPSRPRAAVPTRTC